MGGWLILNTPVHDIVPASTRPPPPMTSGRLSIRILVFLIAVSVIVQLGALADMPLWVQPDSAAYLELAGAILRGDWKHELFLMRPPGYPVLLALLMQAWGENSALGLLLFQRLAVIAIVLLTALTAHAATDRKDVAVLSGVLTAFTWPLTAYAATVLTEIPYTLLSILTLYLILRGLRTGALSSLVGASLAAGAAGLVRPLGLPLLAFCVLTARGRTDPSTAEAGDEPRRGGACFAQWAFSLAAATIPGGLLLSAWAWHVRSIASAGEAGAWARAQLYVRAVQVEGLTQPPSAAFQELRRCVDMVNEQRPPGARPCRVDYPWEAVACYRKVHGASLFDGVRLLGDAAGPIFAAHWPRLLLTTPRHMLRTLLIPDPVYRYRPDVPPTHADPAAADLLSTATHAASVLERVTDPEVRTRLRFHEGGSAGSRAGSALTEAYLSLVERPMALSPPVADSLYETWILFALAGGWLLLHRAWRSPSKVRGLPAGFAMLFGFILVHLFPTALTQGTIPRYAVPVQPVLQIMGAVGLTAVLAVVLRWPRVRAMRRPLAA